MERNIKKNTYICICQDCQEKYQHLRYADDTTLIVENEEELKNLLIKMKEVSENAGLEHSKNEDHDIRSHHFVANKWRGKIETVTDFIFLGSKITAGGDCSHEVKRHLQLLQLNSRKIRKKEKTL